jgi:hypothetical protein
MLAGGIPPCVAIAASMTPWYPKKKGFCTIKASIVPAARAAFSFGSESNATTGRRSAALLSWMAVAAPTPELLLSANTPTRSGFADIASLTCEAAVPMSLLL